MKKAALSAAMILMTLLQVVWTAASGQEGTPVEARLVRTQRRDVIQTIGLAGEIAYEDERYILAETPGSVDQICVDEGQRIAEGDALLRFGGENLQMLAAACATRLEEYAADANYGEAISSMAMAQFVLRAKDDCTVREIMVAEDAAVAAGTPVLRVSGSRQEIRCIASAADAERITPGMWGWISCKGERAGIVSVKSLERAGSASTDGRSLYLIRMEPEQHIDADEGTSVDVELYLRGGSGVVALPLEAITEAETVWWVSDGGICTEIPAGIVLCDESSAWVDLPEGITVAIGEFTNGQRVTEAQP